MSRLSALLWRIEELTFFSPSSSSPQKSFHSGRLQLPSSHPRLKKYFRPWRKRNIWWVYLLRTSSPWWPWHPYLFASSFLWVPLLSFHLLCSFLTFPFLLLGDASRPENTSPFPLRSLFSTFRHQRAPSILQFLENWLVSLCHSHRFTLSFCRGLLFFFSFLCCWVLNFPFLWPRLTSTSSLMLFRSGKSGKKRRKAFPSAYKSDENLQARIDVLWHTSFVITKAKAQAWHETYLSIERGVFVFLS